MISLSFSFRAVPRLEPEQRQTQKLVATYVVGLKMTDCGGASLLWPVWFPGANHPDRGARILANRHARQHKDDTVYLLWTENLGDRPCQIPVIGVLPPDDAEVGQYSPLFGRIEWRRGVPVPPVRPMSLEANNPALLATGLDGYISDALYDARLKRASRMRLVDKLVAATFFPPVDGRLAISSDKLARISERLGVPWYDLLLLAKEFESPRWGRYDWLAMQA